MVELIVYFFTLWRHDFLGLKPVAFWRLFYKEGVRFGFLSAVSTPKLLESFVDLDKSWFHKLTTQTDQFIFRSVLTVCLRIRFGKNPQNHRPSFLGLGLSHFSSMIFIQVLICGSGSVTTYFSSTTRC